MLDIIIFGGRELNELSDNILLIRDLEKYNKALNVVFFFFFLGIFYSS